MSAEMPYVAPWQAGFDRYATQLLSARKLSEVGWQLAIDGGQWWRLIYVTWSVTSSAVVTPRNVFLNVIELGVTARLIVTTPLTISASAGATYLFAPDAAAYANSAKADGQFGSAPVPDLLWRSGVVFQLSMRDNDPGDLTVIDPTFAVEVYVQSIGDRLVLLPAPLEL